MNVNPLQKAVTPLAYATPLAASPIDFSLHNPLNPPAAPLTNVSIQVVPEASIVNYLKAQTIQNQQTMIHQTGYSEDLRILVKFLRYRGPVAALESLCMITDYPTVLQAYVFCLVQAFGWNEANILNSGYSLTRILLKYEQFELLRGLESDAELFYYQHFLEPKYSINPETLQKFLHFVDSKNLYPKTEAKFKSIQPHRFSNPLAGNIFSNWIHSKNPTVYYGNDQVMEDTPAAATDSLMPEFLSEAELLALLPNNSPVADPFKDAELLEGVTSDVTPQNIPEPGERVYDETNEIHSLNTIPTRLIGNLSAENVKDINEIVRIEITLGHDFSAWQQAMLNLYNVTLRSISSIDPLYVYVGLLTKEDPYGTLQAFRNPSFGRVLSPLCKTNIPFNLRKDTSRKCYGISIQSLLEEKAHVFDYFYLHHLQFSRNTNSNLKFSFAWEGLSFDCTLFQLALLFERHDLLVHCTADEINALQKPITIFTNEDKYYFNNLFSIYLLKYGNGIIENLPEALIPIFTKGIAEARNELGFLHKTFETYGLFTSQQVNNLFPQFREIPSSPDFKQSWLFSCMVDLDKEIDLFIAGKKTISNLGCSFSKYLEMPINVHFIVTPGGNNTVPPQQREKLGFPPSGVIKLTDKKSLGGQLAIALSSGKNPPERDIWLLKTIQKKMGPERFEKLLTEKFSYTFDLNRPYSLRLILTKLDLLKFLFNDSNNLDSRPDALAHINPVENTLPPVQHIQSQAPLAPPPIPSIIRKTEREISPLLLYQEHLLLLSSLTSKINEQWILNPKIRKQLYHGIVSSKGVWEFDIAKVDFNFFLAFILKQNQKNTLLQKNAAIQAVKTLIHFMHIYRIPNPAQSDTSPSLLFQKYLSKEEMTDAEFSALILEWCPAKSPSIGDLTEIQSHEAAEIFIRAKLQELALRLKTQKYLEGTQTSSTIPCFVIAQDTQNAHLEILTAFLAGGKSLLAIQNGQRESLEVLTDCGMTIVEEWGRHVAYASVDQLTALHAFARQNRNKLILLERSAFKDFHPLETIEERSAELPRANPIRSSNEAEADNVNPSNKRKNATIDVIHADISVTPQLKKTRAVSQEEKFKNPASVAPEGEYQEVQDIIPIAKPAAKKIKKTGILPIEKGKIPGTSDRPECTDPDDLLNFLSNETATNVLSKVKIEEAKARVISEQTPLKYDCMPLLQKAQTIPIEPLPVLNRLLKNYQQKDLEAINHFAKAGLSKLLCYEMGVGKTFVYGTDLVVQIYQGLKGHAVVITPTAIHNSIHKDLVRVLQEGIFTAWEYLLLHDDGSLIRTLRARLHSANWDDLTMSLMMASCLDLDLWKLQIAQIKNPNLLSPDFIKKVADHVQSRLNNLKNNFKGMEQPLSEIEEARQQLGQIGRLAPVEQLHFLGKLLAFNPGRKLLQEEYQVAGMKRLVEFSFESLHNSKDAKDFKKQLNDQRSKLIIATYDNLLQLIEDKENLKQEIETIRPQLKGIHWIAFDEMQKLQNSKSGISRTVRAFVQEMTNAKKIGVTGTPMENEFEEVITLLDIVNPGQFNHESFEGLMKINQMAVEQLQAKKTEEATKACLLSYIHMTAFQRGLLNHFIMRRTQEDPDVILDWDNRVAQVTPCMRPMILTEESKLIFDRLLENLKSKKEVVDGVEKNFGILSFKKKESRLLLHPSLVYASGNFSLGNPIFDTFISRLKTINSPSDAANQNLNELVKRSPLLNYLWDHPFIQNIKQNNLSAIGFVTDTVMGKAIKVLLNRMGIQARFYRATGLNEEKREERLKWFKTPEAKPKFLVLTFGSGATGFSLPEAAQVWMFDDVWNPKKESQALYRAKRIGFKTSIFVIKYHNDLFSKHHVDAVLSNKDNLFDFLFKKYDSNVLHYKAWINYLEGLIYHKFLNSNKNQEKAIRKIDEIKEISSSISESYTDEELERGITNVMPRAPISATTIPLISRSNHLAREILDNID